MAAEPERVCIILARSGSKRIKQKNIQQINSKSLVEYAIDCCVETKINTILSSDSDQILEFGRNKPVQLHKRTSDNSTDLSSSESALIEVLSFFDISFETEIVLVPPTNPMRTSIDLLYFLDQWDTHAKPNGYDQGFSSLSIKNDFWFEENQKYLRARDKIFNQIESRRSVERSNLYLETSALYVSSAELIYKGMSIVGSKPYPIELSRYAAFDIDTQIDLDIVRNLLK